MGDLAPVSSCWGQINPDQSPTRVHPIQAHLDAGEFPLAISMAERLPRADSDDWFSRIALAQMSYGSSDHAFQSAGQISEDQQRAEVLSRLADSTGVLGGVSINDFEPLINLITNTIANDSWLETGQGLGTIQAFPAGVFVDGSGVLKKLRANPGSAVRGIRSSAFADSGNRQPQWESELRKVSLTRLEKMAQLRAARGLPLDAVMQNLAGLTEIKYVMAFPETGEIVIAGPAGPWQPDARQRSVNIQHGKPVLQLDDLVVCLRNAWENDGKFGCSITPRQQNLADTKHFLATTTLHGAVWSRALQKTLGEQDIEVFGIDPGTHAARVLVESDYRMKLMGMGLEPSVIGVPSYLERVQLGADGSVPSMDVARWWFTLNYDNIVSDPGQTTFAFTGNGVKVLSETELLDDLGQRIHTGQSHGPTQSFARDFTKHFSKIADQYPIYRELKNVFDMALVASLIRHQRLAERTHWNLTFFGPADSSGLHYPVALAPIAKTVDTVMNERVLKVRKQHSTVKHRLVGVSGGVSFDAHEVVRPEKILVDDHSILSDEAKRSQPMAEESHWWWD
jgi:hypothetical protein